MKFLSLIGLAICFASPSFSSVLQTTTGSKEIEGVRIAQSGTFNMKGQDTALQIVGAGLRKKKVAILKVKIYVGELLASDSQKFVRTPEGALESLNLSSTLAMRLNFLYSVDGPTIKQAFSEALRVNSINTSEPAMAKLLEVISKAGEFNAGESIVFVAQKEENGSETLYFEDPRMKISEINGSAGFSKNFFSLWLGKTADDQTADLKSQLIKGL